MGDALAECGLPREEFFLTTKVWITNSGYKKAKASIEESMRKLWTAAKVCSSPTMTPRSWNDSCLSFKPFFKKV